MIVEIVDTEENVDRLVKMADELCLCHLDRLSVHRNERLSEREETACEDAIDFLVDHSAVLAALPQRRLYGAVDCRSRSALVETGRSLFRRSVRLVQWDTY